MLGAQQPHLPVAQRRLSVGGVEGDQVGERPARGAGTEPAQVGVHRRLELVQHDRRPRDPVGGGKVGGIDDLRAAVLQRGADPFQRVAPRIALVVPESGPGDADARAAQTVAAQVAAVVDDRRAVRGRVLLIRARDHGEHPSGVLHAAGERPGGILAEGDRHDAGPGDQPDGRFDAGDAVGERRRQDRAGGFGADRGGAQSGGHGRRRPGARRGDRQRRMMRVDDLSAQRAVAARHTGRHVVCQLGHVGLADDERAGRAQAADQGRVGRRERIGQGQRAGAGRHRSAAGIDVVLQEHRHAVQGADGGAGTPLGIEAPGGPLGIRVDAQHGVEGRAGAVDGRDARQGARKLVPDGRFAAAIGVEQPADRAVRSGRAHRRL